MTKVALVNIGEYRKYGQIDEGLGVASVGLESIAAHLHNNGVDAVMIDQAMYGFTYDEIIARILEMHPAVVGLNPLNNSRKAAGELAARIKEQLPKTTVVIGGYDATFLSLDHAFYSHVDAIVRGKGEIPMLELAQGKPLSKIQGIAYRDQGIVQDTLESRAQSLSPEQLPIPLRQNLHYLAESKEPVSIYASYGCFYSCTFCSTPGFYTEGRVERKLEDVLKEIDFLADNGIRKFSFYDEDFFGFTQHSLERATAIVDKVREKNGTITFSFITTQGIHQAEKYGFLEQWQGTVNRLYVGVEGGCDQALKGLGNKSCLKSTRNAQAIDTVRKYDIELQIGFIMFNPYSTFDELEHSAQFLYDHHEAVNGISFFHHLRPYNGTKMYDQLKNQGLLIEEEVQSEINLHSSLPYHFKADVDAGNEAVKDFARAICPTSAEPDVCISDKLNNEIYSHIVTLGYAREIFSEDPAPDIVSRYRELRRDIAQTNYDYFMDSLRLFRDNQGKGYQERKQEYLSQLHSLVVPLQELKKEIE